MATATKDAHAELDQYLREVRLHPLLSREEELVLARRYRAGDLAAGRRLVTANLRLVVKLSHEYRRAHHDLRDLVQEGNLGLLAALEKFDPERNVRFPSYAAWWIRAYVLRFIVSDFSLIKIGTSPLQRKLFFNLRKEKRKLESRGFVPTAARLAQALQAPEQEVIDMDLRLDAREVRLDAPAFRSDEGSPSKLDELTSDADEQPEAMVADGELKERLHERLAAFGDTLDGRERTLFDDRLVSDDPKSLAEIGARYGISRERARQVEKALLGRLRRYLARELGDAVTVETAPGAANDNAPAAKLLAA